MQSLSIKIRARFENITEELISLITRLSIVEFIKPTRGVIVMPRYYFDVVSAADRAKQISICEEYEKIFEILSYSFKNTPESLLSELKQSNKSYRLWLDLDSNWSLRNDASENEKRIREVSKEFEDFFKILDAKKGDEIILIPDTSSLLVSCDPLEYSKKINVEKFTILILPTVLAELDELKILHRNNDVREKAKSVINRFKGWRNQGSLLDGVKVNKSITVKTISNEPDMQKTLTWLKSDVRDDRIIASTIDIQAKYSSSNIILCTQDINLQNKSEAALISFIELDD